MGHSVEEFFMAVKHDSAEGKVLPNWWVPCSMHLKCPWYKVDCRSGELSQSFTIPSSTPSAINPFPAWKVSSSLSTRSRGSPISLSPDRSDRNIRSVFPTADGLRFASQSPPHPGSDNAFLCVWRHLFGTNDVRIKAEEGQDFDKVLNPLLSSLESDVRLGHILPLYPARPASSRRPDLHTHCFFLCIHACVYNHHTPRRSMLFNMSSTAGSASTSPTTQITTLTT